VLKPDDQMSLAAQSWSCVWMS